MSTSRDALLAVVESGAVAVRMYRPGGLGDCFLLAFPPADAPRFMLIDCGVFFATGGGADRMRAIVADVAEVTGGRLDLLVATHEHWDHLSGFQFAEEQFLDFEVEEVWVAWTEDNTHPLARALRDKRHRLAAALQAAVAEMARQDDPAAGQVADVLGFDLGLDADGGGDRGLGLLGVGGTAGQMDFVCSAFGTPRYLTPGGRAIEWAASGVRFYVLGPPEDRELITRSDPSASDSEVYERAAAPDEASAFAVAALHAAEDVAMDDEERRMMDQSRPFDDRYRLTPDAAEAMEFFQRRYGFGDERQDGHGPPWRRIGADWLSAAGQLALQLNNDTNNTSLALAVELAASGRVLLFPADAQVGNWLSWQDHVWTVDDGGGGDGGGGERQVVADDLLSRTVLYKVGHHGSHNATLREHGLEKMTHPELVAMIPVDEEQAGEKGWAMPFEALEKRLRERTKGRVLRADRGLPQRPENVPEADWRAFEERTAADDLWVQYAVPL